MNSMAIDRRSFLIGSLLALQPATPALADSGETAVRYAAAAKLNGERYGVLLLNHEGSVLREIPLSARGHDIAFDAPTGRAVAFARRPGSFAVAFSVKTTSEPVMIPAADGRHFYGHGMFSADGRLLYATENIDEEGRGCIGVYDVAADFRRIGELDSFGIGPHDLLLLPDGRTLAVANGGLDTTVETGRINLNVADMQPSLTFIDAVTGSLLAQHPLTDSVRYLSIRHLAADALDRVWFGGQWEGDVETTPELVGCAGRDTAITLISPPEPHGRSLKGYIGAMAATRDGQVIAASAPRAGRVIYIDALKGTVCGESELPDGCGIAGADGHTFATSSGLGVFRYDRAGTATFAEQHLAGIAFDNHLRRMGG